MTTITTEAAGYYRPLQSAGAEALRVRRATRRRGRALVLSSRLDAASPLLMSALRARALEPVTVRLTRAELPDPASAALLVLAGAEPYATARTERERQRELDWLRAADEAGTPVLGIGHGARALADALGGEVRPASEPYRGWAFVDTVAPHQIAAGPWVTWQHDVITLPPEATLIAHNRFGAQAFRLGRHLGVQFHPDATASAFERWAPTAPDDAWHFTTTTRRDPRAAQVCAEQLFGTWLSTVGGSGVGSAR